MAVTESVIEFVFKKVRAFTINGNERVCDGVCFKLQIVMEFTFSKTSDESEGRWVRVGG